MAHPALRRLLAVMFCAPACADDGGDGGEDGGRELRCVDLPRPPSKDLLRLERVLPDVEIEGGVDLQQAPGLPDRWYLVTQAGVVYRFPVDGGAPSVVLDLSDQVAVGGEAGLLGMAFHPDFADNG